MYSFLENSTTGIAILGMNPTKTELTAYMKQKNGKMAFADFLDVMHTHSSKENLPKELLDAFKCYDTQKRGVIHAKDLRRILVKWGEQLSSKEGKAHHRSLKKAPWFILWQYGFWSFQTGYIKLERFLPKNQHARRIF